MSSSLTQLKILKTKKRLSDKATKQFFFFALIGLVFNLVVHLRWAYTPFGHDMVPMAMPSISFSKIENPAETVLAFTYQGFLIGNVNAFTTKLSGIRNKFSVPHDEGQPQASLLVSTIEALMAKGTLEKGSVAILIPDSSIPMAMVVKVIHVLNQSKLFSAVVLGAGLV